MAATSVQFVAPQFLPTTIGSSLYTVSTGTSQITSVVLANVNASSASCGYTLYVGGSGLNNAIFGNNVVLGPNEVTNIMSAVTIPSGTCIYGTCTIASGITMHMSGIQYT